MNTSNFLLLPINDSIFSAHVGANEDTTIVINPNDVAFQSRIPNIADSQIEDVPKTTIIRSCNNLILLWLKKFCIIIS